MPLLSPDIQQALREVGLANEPSTSVADRLDRAGMSLDSTIEQLTDLAHAASNDAIRLRALETVLKLRGILKEQAPPPPSITIMINDPGAEARVNPILFPREMSAPTPKIQIPPEKVN